MKVKIKGLVFVGFAAAILSANAMAASDNTVTSKTYVDTHFQQKSTAASIGNSSGGWTNLTQSVTSSSDHTTAPTAKAVYDAIGTAVQQIEDGAVYQAKSTVAQQVSDGAGGWQYLTKDTTVTENSDNPVTSGAVYAAIAAQAQDVADDFQPQTDSNLQLGGANGTWADLGTGFANGAYTTKSVDTTTGIVTIDANATTDGALPVTDANKLPTASAVKTYVDSKATAAASDILADTPDATDDDHALTNAATTTALNGKQDKDTTNVYKVGLNGTWTAVNSAVADSGAHITTTNETDGSVTINVSDTTNVGSGITASSTSLTEGKAVYEYVQSQTGGNVIPAKPDTCTATDPCALVTEGNNIVWKPIAQSEATVGA